MVSTFYRLSHDFTPVLNKTESQENQLECINVFVLTFNVHLHELSLHHINKPTRVIYNVPAHKPMECLTETAE